MTRDQAEQAMATDVRVIAHAGEDTDTGFILELIGDSMALVGWDSCSQSECSIESLDLAASRIPSGP